ncbi:hypothetical protein B0T24DRAFT_142489 [Lasiosphaeria ovina]|uniref:Uncharacterized protein n=1 Tax=Lasiosphaeria ovina TaxID=92902 RepID=A0AAE0ND11_9PEZI|nr:hypothetical protein B0T24DRAFT_142489 [Lasiosphaeria ovina]
MPCSMPRFSTDSNTGPPHVPLPQTTRVQRNKLRKRPPFWSPDTSTAAYDLCQLMGNNASFEIIPRPARPPRPSATDIPDLPNLPMYENFTSKHRPVTLLDEKTPRVYGRRPSMTTTRWSSADGPRPRWDAGAGDERPATHHSLAASDTTAVEVPRYDRSSRLAESYRNVLPDRESMTIEYREARGPIKRQQATRRPRSQQREPHASNHPTRNQTVATPEQERFDVRSAPARTRSSTVPSTPTSSITAVDYDLGPVDGLALGKSRPPCSHSREADSQRDALSSNKERRTSEYVGLQICSELLTEELTRTFFRQHPGETQPRASKLQVLLLIEAYEAMLDSCRRELLKPPPARGGERRKGLRDAVRILDHWLDSLYVIYDDTFSDEAEGVTAEVEGMI